MGIGLGEEWNQRARFISHFIGYQWRKTGETRERAKLSKDHNLSISMVEYVNFNCIFESENLQNPTRKMYF